MSAVRLARSSVLPPDQELKILLLGDAGVGKTSIVQAYASKEFPPQEALRPVFDPIQILSEPETVAFSGRDPITNPRIVIDTNGVELGSSASAIAREIGRHSPDVILLTFSCEEPMTLARLATHWLPAIVAAGCAKPSWPYIPICICGAKSDAFDKDDRASWASAYRMVNSALKERGLLVQEQDDDEEGGGGGNNTVERIIETAESSAALQDRALEDMLMSFRGILATITLSAAQPTHVDGLGGELSMLWDKTTELVLHPLFPVFDPLSSSFLPSAQLAVSRIFRILDADGDGVLSIDEFSAYQTLVYGVRLSDAEVEMYLMKQAEEFPDGVVGIVATSGGGGGGGGNSSVGGAVGLTEAGFHRMLVEHIYHTAVDAVWQTLHAFGYRWGIPSPSTANALYFGMHQNYNNNNNSSSSGSVSGATRQDGVSRRVPSTGGTSSTSSSTTFTTEKRLYLYIPDAYTVCLPSSSDSFLQLSGTSALEQQMMNMNTTTTSKSITADYTTATLEMLCKRGGPLRFSGLGFIARLFRRYMLLRSNYGGNSATTTSSTSTASMKTTLSPEDIEDMFSICSTYFDNSNNTQGHTNDQEGNDNSGLSSGNTDTNDDNNNNNNNIRSGIVCHPFGKLYPSTTTHNANGEIALVTWIHLWQTLLACEPRKALVALYGLGYTLPSSYTGTTNTNTSSTNNNASSSYPQFELDHDPRKAVEDGIRRKAGVNVPAPVRRVFVVGSAGSGKTSMIIHYLNGPTGLREYMMANNSIGSSTGSGGVGGAITKDDTGASSAVHFAAAAPLRRGEVANSTTTTSASSSTPPVTATSYAIPLTLAITEWPANKFQHAMDAASDGAADAIIFVVDPSSPSSLQYFITGVNSIPDDVPTIVVATQHDSRKSVAGDGYKILKAVCSSSSSSSSSQGESLQFKELVTKGVQSTIFAEVLLLGPEADRKKMLPSSGLDLEVFEFGPKSKAIKTEELFKYVTLRTPTPSRDNPRTQARRAREERAKWIRRGMVAGCVLVVLSTVGGVVAYSTDYKGTRQGVDTRMQAIKDSAVGRLLIFGKKNTVVGGK